MECNGLCAIWGTPAFRGEYRGEDGTFINSPRAGGKYLISGTAEAILESNTDVIDNLQKARLTTWLVDQRRLGSSRPAINANLLEETSFYQNLQIINRADRILKYLEKMTSHIGERITYKVFRKMHQEVNLEPAETTYLEVLAHSECTSYEELIFLINYLNQLEYIQFSSGSRNFGLCFLTVAGYKRLEVLSSTYTPSDQAFVAMWFNDLMKEPYENGIEPGIRDAGYESFRVDQKEHNNKIDDEIIAGIRESKFVVADFTQGEDGARGGVYYEAGFAKGLGREVIFMCHENSVNSLHFDTRQYNHIVWETPEELRKQLTNRIRAVVGQGPIPPISNATIHEILDGAEEILREEGRIMYSREILERLEERSIHVGGKNPASNLSSKISQNSNGRFISHGRGKGWSLP